MPQVAWAGVISDAQPLTVGLNKILDFLLSLIGILGILGMILAGVLYFLAAGDVRQSELAKKAFIGGITGIVIALGGYVLIRAVTALL